jgi:GT2 family glycosyltransferase
MVSILIVNWNTRDLLAACLKSIPKHLSSIEHETIVVDNASTDRSAEMVPADFPEVKLIANQSNEGYARGNNDAFESASGAYLLTLNPDTEFVDDSLANAIRLLDVNPTVAAIGAKQIQTDGSTQRSVRGFPSLGAIARDIFGLPNKYRMQDFDYEKEQLVDQPMGTFLLFKREALEAIGSAKKPFDENFPIFFNEVDLLYRLKKAGWQCLYSPEVRILHHGGEGTKQVRKPMIWESHRSLVRFLKKHYLTWWNAPLYYLVFGIIYAGAWIRARGYSAGFSG